MAERRRTQSTSGESASPAASAVAEPALPERAADQLPAAPSEGLLNAWRSRIVRHAMVDPRTIKPNPRNPRVHPDTQMTVLDGVLDQLGWIQSCVVNVQTENLIDGHARRERAIERNEATVPVVYVDLSPDEELLALATFDPIAGLASIDLEAHAALMLAASQQTVVQPVLSFLHELGDKYAPSADAPPEEFPEYDAQIVTEHECPKCGYKWSGMASSSRHSVRDAHGGQ